MNTDLLKTSVGNYTRKVQTQEFNKEKDINNAWEKVIKDTLENILENIQKKKK